MKHVGNYAGIILGILIADTILELFWEYLGIIEHDACRNNYNVHLHMYVGNTLNTMETK